MLIDVKAIQKEVQTEITKEQTDKAKMRLKAQMLAVENAKAVLGNEQRKLDDLLHAISEGN